VLTLIIDPFDGRTAVMRGDLTPNGRAHR
jgi:hypothetical protein